jgi:hypothetical protein
MPNLALDRTSRRSSSRSSESFRSRRTSRSKGATNDPSPARVRM